MEFFDTTNMKDDIKQMKAANSNSTISIETATNIYKGIKDLILKTSIEGSTFFVCHFIEPQPSLKIYIIDIVKIYLE